MTETLTEPVLSPPRKPPKPPRVPATLTGSRISSRVKDQLLEEEAGGGPGALEEGDDMIPVQACTLIVKIFEEFIHHKRDWDNVLDGVQETVDALSYSSYSVGYSDAKGNNPESPLQVDDWRWRLRVLPW